MNTVINSHYAALMLNGQNSVGILMLFDGFEVETDGSSKFPDHLTLH